MRPGLHRQRVPASFLALTGFCSVAAAAARAQDTVYDPTTGVRGVCVRYCNSPTPRQQAPGPPQPSAEERRRQLDAEDLQEAADDAQDRGQAAYDRGDIAGAVRLFQEAADYAPDDPDISQNLARARERLTEINGLAARQSVATAGGQSEHVFDGRGQGRNVGGIAVGSAPVVAGVGRDPVVPRARMTPALRQLERERTERRARIATIDAELRTLNPSTDAIGIARRQQQRSEAASQVQFINITISETLRAPPPAPAAPRR